jgi:IS605 OrfB family transposase
MIRCYKYWATPASEPDAKLLINALRLGGDYRHALIDIENRKRALERALWATPMRLVPIEDRRKWRADGGDAVLRAWTKSEEYSAWRSKIRDGATAAVRWARGQATARGLHFGTYWTVEEAVSTAARTTKWESDLGHRGHFKVGAPLDANHKPTVAGIFGDSHTRLRISSEAFALQPFVWLDDEVHGYRARAEIEWGQRQDGTRVAIGPRNRSGGVQPARFREVAIRVGSQGREPIWARLNVLMLGNATNRTRALPEGRVAQAWAQRHFVGGRMEWEVVFAIEQADRPAPAHSSALAVGIDVGWRRRDDGVRVAYWYGSDGSEGEVVVPVEVERRKAKSDDLRSIRDQNRNALIDAICTWAAGRPGTWLDQALAHARQWTRIGRLVGLERKWRAQRIAGDDEIYSSLKAFLKRDLRHLWPWQVANQQKMRRQILEQLRAWAHDICRRYATIVIEDLDLASLKEVDDPARINARSIQRLAPAEVALALKHACARTGAKIIRIDPAYTTRTCAACGVVREVADQKALVLTCHACGTAEDQDRTAARNLLASASVAQALPGPLAPSDSQGSARKPGPRRNRRRAQGVAARNA